MYIPPILRPLFPAVSTAPSNSKTPFNTGSVHPSITSEIPIMSPL